MPDNPSGFSPATLEWFTGTFAAPTPAQAQAWSAIARGDNTLVIAPTGSGKTLAAFLWAIDRLANEPAGGPGTRVLYVSPLKALAVDVERNLRTPLTGITRTAQRLGLPDPQISVGVRSGDTPPSRRRELITRPPDILITTPESLFLMLTSAARETLAGVQTVIVDEVHAVAGTKRGSHLALSLERLDGLLQRPAQRIGLSATVRPAEEVARFLVGAAAAATSRGAKAPCTIVAPPAAKTFDLSVVVPVPDMANLDNNTIWPAVEQRIADLIEAHQSTIVFANSRRLAERLTSRLNEIHAERSGIDLLPHPNPEVPGGPPAQIMASGQSYGAAPLLARAHHGSVSKEQRAAVEDDLKSGRLKAVVATSSLELGIDMGAVDLVIQVEAPPSVANGLQRIGRAGHQVGEISRGVVFPKHRTDLISCAVTVQRMLAGQIESLTVPANPLDVLAQHTIAACALEPLDADRWFDTVRRSAPFATLPRSAFEATLDLLSGKYPSTEFAELRPRLVYDRDAGLLTARPGAQRLAVTSGGAIPDRGLFTVYLAAGADSEKPSRVGELDEEMVYESRPGDVISLGATSWRITEITHDRVLVIPAFGEPARLPFWRGDAVGRPAELGAALGVFTGELARLKPKEFEERCAAMGFDRYATDNLRGLLDDQQQATGAVPTDSTLVVERFRDELGDWRVILHSPYGLRVHGPLALAVSRRLRERYGIDEKPTASDDGIVVRLPDTEDVPPGADLFVFEPDEVEPIVTAEVGGSALFASRFRECAARALLLPRRHPGKRSPLWHQRQRAAQLLDVARKYPDFPIVLEAVRECLQDVYDVPALHRADGRASPAAPDPGGRGPDRHPVAVRRVAVVRLRRRVHVRRRRPAGRAPRGCAVAGHHPAGRAAGPGRAARTAGPRGHRGHPPPAAAPQPRTGSPGTPRRVADLLRLLGPLTKMRSQSAAPRPISAAGCEGLRAARRAVTVSFAGRTWWVAVEDIGRLRDGVGIAVPIGCAGGLHRAGDRPAGRPDRPLRPHPRAVHHRRGRVAVRARSAGGRRRAGPAGRRRQTACAANSRPGRRQIADQWCDAEVLRMLRRRSLAALRAQVEPVSTAAFGGSCPPGSRSARRAPPGSTALAAVIEQLAGVADSGVRARAAGVSGQRVRDYQPAMLDELLAVGRSRLVRAVARSQARDGWIALHLTDTAPLSLSPARPNSTSTTSTGPSSTPLESAAAVSSSASWPTRTTTPRTPEGRPVGTGLGRLGHRRHLRAGARPACRIGPRGRRLPTAAPTATAAQPLQHRARTDPRRRPDRRGRWSALPAPPTGFDGAGPLPRRTAARAATACSPRAVSPPRACPAGSRRCTRC